LGWFLSFLDLSPTRISFKPAASRTHQTSMRVGVVLSMP
jgi:hypothetical protein